MRILATCAVPIALLAVSAPNAERRSVSTETVSVCAVAGDPAAHNHKLIDVSGIVSHGFEKFTLTNQNCPQSIVWLEYGGRLNSDTVSCCGNTAQAPRPAPFAIDGVAVPLIDDAMFHRFDDRIREGGDAKFGAALRGRFFAGEKRRSASGGEFWAGFGHLGCCTLLVIQQVLSVDEQITPKMAKSRATSQSGAPATAKVGR